MQLIVKYTNRKLYNRNSSSYITLDDIKNYVLRGEDFTVTDKNTGADLTNEVLSSAVAELVIIGQKNPSSMLKAMLVNAFQINTLQEDYTI